MLPLVLIVSTLENDPIFCFRYFDHVVSINFIHFVFYAGFIFVVLCLILSGEKVTERERAMTSGRILYSAGGKWDRISWE